MKIKRKGAYTYLRPEEENAELGYHQNHSMLIVPKAAEAFLIHGIDLREYITNHDNLYDFLLRAKIPRSSRLVGRSEDGDVNLQNTCRYYVSIEGVSLIKIMPPLKGKEEYREIGIQSKQKVTICNRLNGITIDDIRHNLDYEYYINEAEKLTNLVEPDERDD